MTHQTEPAEVEQLRATIERVRSARRRVNSALIAVQSHLTTPYPDDPRWTPWTRFVGPALKELTDALRAAPAPAAVSAAVAPPTDRATAEAALAAVETALGDTLLPDAREEALAGITAELPPTIDRAAVLADVERAIRTATSSCGYKAEDGCDFCNGVDTALDQVRRMADETATVSPAARVHPGNRADETATETPQPSLRDQHRAAWHALTPDQQTARIAELDTTDEPAAETQQDETATETPNVYLTTPCDACNHTLNWHSSGETGCTVPRCACARYYHAAGARQDEQPFAGDTRRCLSCTHDMDAHIRVNGKIECAFDDCTDPAPAGARQDGAET